MKYRVQSTEYRAKILYFILCLILINSLGCEAFTRKFTRKPKKESLPPTEMILAPEEYRGTLTREELYRQYFLFWKSWQDELINSLSIGANHKKQMDSLNEALKNLEQLKIYLNIDKQKTLEGYIQELADLKGALSNDVYGTNISVNRYTAERIKRGILRDLSYNKIKDFLL